MHQPSINVENKELSAVTARIVSWGSYMLSICIGELGFEKYKQLRSVIPAEHQASIIFICPLIYLEWNDRVGTGCGTAQANSVQVLL